jgi:hypothetical protein
VLRCSLLDAQRRPHEAQLVTQEELSQYALS